MIEPSVQDLHVSEITQLRKSLHLLERQIEVLGYCQAKDKNTIARIEKENAALRAENRQLQQFLSGEAA